MNGAWQHWVHEIVTRNYVRSTDTEKTISFHSLCGNTTILGETLDLGMLGAEIWYFHYILGDLVYIKEMVIYSTLKYYNIFYLHM